MHAKWRQEMHVLESSSLELIDFVEKEADKNPLLHFQKPLVTTEKIEQTPDKKDSYLQDLQKQIHDYTQDPKSIEALEKILGNLDEKGFYKGPFLDEFEQKMQKVFQTFEPFGSGSSSLRECLLVQLEQKNLQNTLSYQILSSNYSLLIKKRYTKLQKIYQIPIESIKKDLKKHVKPLYTKPRNDRFLNFSLTLCPDLFLDREGNVSVDLHFPKLYLKAPNSKDPANLYWMQQARSLERHLLKRKRLLKSVMELVYKTQKDFFLYGENLQILTIRSVAKKLKIHESVIRRIVQKKFVAFEGQIFSMKTFFSREARGCSQHHLEQMVKSILEHEDKLFPLSDEMISRKLAEKGLFVSRRTVTKYRKKLQIPNKYFRV